MRGPKEHWVVIGLILSVVLVLFPASVSAQSAGGYDLSWSTVDGGGGASTGGSFRVVGTVGQPDAGAASGSGLHLSSGYWGGIAPDYRVFLPLLLRQQP